MPLSPQIPLELDPVRPDRIEDFVAGANGPAVAALLEVLDKPGSSVYLSGPDQSGKSHLLNAVCHRARERGLAAFYIGLKRLPEDAAAGLEGLQGLDLVCVDDIEAVAGNAVWEQALFHCFNQVRSMQGRLVISSNLALTALPLELPDLSSRLGWGVHLQLRLLDDEGKLRVLQHRAAALGLELPSEVLNYLISRGRRDIGFLLEVLDRLKLAAFAAKRRITVPLVREVLASARENGP
jgi:DnaA family protein